jgi:3-oxoacyl-[acyl-carrier protein] reductase
MINENKIILITGTRKGIGRFLSENYLAKENIVIGCSRSATDLQHFNYRHFEVDVTNEAEVKKMFRQVYREFGRLDVLINNAGIASMNHSLLTTINTAQKIFETNVIGTFLFCREAAKLMMKSKNGRIINFSTVAVPLRLEGEAIYAASKAAVNSLTQVLAIEFSSFGITVNAIGPTPIQTDLIKNIPEEKIDSLLSRIPLKRLGTFEDLINVADFFIKPESNFITGQIIYMGGVS